MMKPILNEDRGMLRFIKHKDPKGMSAYFGGYDEWKKIGDWDSFVPPSPSKEVTYLDHGYDESKEIKDLTVKELQEAAKFRGGKLLSKKYSGDPYEALRWEGAMGYEFDASPFAVLKAGHWCRRKSATFGTTTSSPSAARSWRSSNSDLSPDRSPLDRRRAFNSP
ncbi:MAG: hypothetical protein U1U88_001078 [Lawsonella clevelandensis]